MKKKRDDGHHRPKKDKPSPMEQWQSYKRVDLMTLMDMHEEIQYELQCLQRDVEQIHERMNAYSKWSDKIAARIKRESK